MPTPRAPVEKMRIENGTTRWTLSFTWEVPYPKPRTYPVRSADGLAPARCASRSTPYSCTTCTTVPPYRLTSRPMVKAEAVEALLYGNVTWTVRQEHYKKLRTVHHRVLLRIIRKQRRSRDHRILSHYKALQATNCESIETTVRTWRLLWAGAIM